MQTSFRPPIFPHVSVTHYTEAGGKQKGGRGRGAVREAALALGPAWLLRSMGVGKSLSIVRIVNQDQLTWRSS